MKIKSIRIFTILLSIILFQGCSLKSPKNQWEYNSSNAFTSYTKYFLINENELANSDLQRAIKYAKQSANLEQLARIYLGVCALNISVGIEDKCSSYTKIREFLNKKELESYFLMLVKKEEIEQITYLPKQYQSFVKYKLEKRFDLAFNAIKEMQEITSQFVAASLIKEKVSKSDMNYLIKKASFNGYKNFVLFWLKNLYKIENDLEKKKKILKKIIILKD